MFIIELGHELLVFGLGRSQCIVYKQCPHYYFGIASASDLWPLVGAVAPTERTRTDILVPSRAKWIAKNPMSDQAPSPGTESATYDKQVINDLDDMHDRFRELWVEMELEGIHVPLLQSTFQRTYHQLDSSPKPQQIARLSKMVQQLEMILSKKKTGRKNSESASIELESKTGASGVPSADSAVSKLSCARNIAGASADCKA